MNNLERCQRCGKLALGGETVTIAADEYESLIKSAAEAKMHSMEINRYRRVSRSAIARNPAIADFIIKSLETMTITEAHKAAVEKFGSSVPSRSTVHRFLQAMKYR